MAHSFYVMRHGTATSVDIKTAPKKTELPRGNPAGESVTAPVSKTSTLRSGSVPAGG